jgi:hypothetical protein
MKQINKKSILFLLCLSLFTSILSVPAFAAVRTGESCSKLNQTSTFNGFKYTCVKSGKKLVWSKGVKVSTPAPMPTAVPAPSASPTPVPTPPATPTATPKPTLSATPTPTPTPKNFSDLWENGSGIALAAWTKSKEAMTNSKVTLLPVEIYRGASTPLYYSSTEALKGALTKVARMYPDAILPTKIVIFYYTRPEMPWGEAKAKEIMGADYQNAFDAHGGPMIKCNLQDDCDDGDAFVGANDISYIAIGVPLNPTDQVKAHSASMQGEMVEFYHSLQEMYYKRNNSYQKNVDGIAAPNKPPHWLSVGGENLTSQLITNDNNFVEFKNNAGGISGWAASLGYDFSDASLDQYLSISNLGNYWSNNRAAKGKIDVIMGQYLMIIMVALKGPNVMLEFHKQMSAGTGFEEAFKNIFGTTWSSAQPELKRVLQYEYKNGY